MTRTETDENLEKYATIIKWLIEALDAYIDLFELLYLGIEVDSNTFLEWKRRIQCFHDELQTMVEKFRQLYDLLPRVEQFTMYVKE
jgi:hypothetical protein